MISEFAFIENLKKRYGLSRVGDDCAVMPFNEEADLLITADLLIEDIDFRLHWTIPEFLGRKSLAVSLSDIAAMGGRPKWAMLSLGVPLAIWDSGFVERFFEGWHALAAEYGVDLVGGDLSRSPDRLVIDCIAAGDVPSGMAILRVGARPGDGIFVSRPIGAAAGSLKLLEGGLRTETSDPFTRELLLRQLAPEPEVKLGNLLRTQSLATAMIDISDGLSSDLEHLCRASGVGALINLEKIPISKELHSQFPESECFELALNGGEDFALLFTGSAEGVVAANLPNVVQIGEVTSESGQIAIRRGNEVHRLDPRGYRHF